MHSGTVLFTLIGFCGLYFVLGLLFLFLVGREIAHGRKPPKALQWREQPSRCTTVAEPGGPRRCA